MSQIINLYLFKFAEFVVFAQLFQAAHRLGVVETIIMIDFAISRQLTELIDCQQKQRHNHHSLANAYITN